MATKRKGDWVWICLILLLVISLWVPADVYRVIFTVVSLGLIGYFVREWWVSIR